MATPASTVEEEAASEELGVGAAEDGPPGKPAAKARKRIHFYSNEQLQSIELCYYIACVLWVGLILYFDLVDGADGVVMFILLIPILVYILGLWSLSEVSLEDENRLLANSYLSIGILVIVPLLTWTHDRFGEETKILQIIVVAIILAVASLIDIWVPARRISVVRHMRSILQVASLALIIYVLYHIFLSRGLKKPPLESKDTKGQKPEIKIVDSSGKSQNAVLNDAAEASLDRGTTGITPMESAFRI